VRTFVLLRETYLKMKQIEKKLDIISFKKHLASLCKQINLNTEILDREINTNFSGGEMKKLEFIFSIILEPKYIIYDEIDSGLDTTSKIVLYKKINEMKNNGRGIMIISHNDISKYVKPDLILDTKDMEIKNV